MTQLSNDNDPKLAIDTSHINDSIGRLYHKPGLELSQHATMAEIQDMVQKGELVPSTTNVISVKSSPHLIRWAAKQATTTLLTDVVRNPKWFSGMSDNRFDKAVDHYSKESERIRDASGLQGSNVHNACEHEAKGLPLPIPFNKLTQNEQKMIEAWRRWVDTFQPEFQHLEITGFGQTPHMKGYAQTTDFFAKIKNMNTIGDYKCVTNDTKILMSDGTSLRADEVTEGQLVAAWTKDKGLHSAPISYVGDNGEHETVTITTATGHTVTTTTNHPFWSSRKTKNLGWVNAEDLRTGDDVYLSYGWDYSTARKEVEWPYNRNLSPYLYGLLWSLGHFNNVPWTENTYLSLPTVSRETLRDELKFIGFVFDKAGRVSLKRAINKIARKNGISFQELADMMTSASLPNYVHTLNLEGKQAFIAGIKEIFANKEKFPDDINIIFKEEEPIRELQQFFLNYGHPAIVNINNNSSYPHLRTFFEDDNTVYTHGSETTRIVKITQNSIPQPTVAIEVKGSHTHITGGIISHNTNRKGTSVDVALQLAANQRTDTLFVDNITPIEQPKTELALAVHLGTNRATTHIIDTSDEVYDTFVGLREAWDFQAFANHNAYRKTSKSLIVREINSLKDL